MVTDSGISSNLLIAGLLVLVVVLIFLNILVLIRQNSLYQRYRKFMSGKDGKSMESAIARRIDEIDSLMVANQENEDLIKKIDARTGNAIQKTGVYKYDAFEEQHGSLSFALALLDVNNDGVVINSVHNGEGCFVYFKEIIHGNSYTKLSNEEQEAVDRAMNIEDED